MIDTHCHLNFKAFDNQVDAVITRAKMAGVDKFIVPGTDIETSKKAVKLAEKQDGIYAAVGIHPHHIYQYQVQSAKCKVQSYNSKLKSDLEEIEKLLNSKKVVAVGEVGIDKFVYQKTKYETYRINPEFVNLQKQLFIAQIKLAIKYKKSLIIHSREAAGETLRIIGDSSILNPLAGHIVFHCCEANEDLLDFALTHQIYIGVDGDVTYSKTKEKFVKKIPLELLVLETDSPFLLPEPLRSERNSLRLRQDFGGQANEPKNVKLIAEKIAEIKNISINQLIEKTTENTECLFSFAV